MIFGLAWWEILAFFIVPTALVVVFFAERSAQIHDLVDPTRIEQKLRELAAEYRHRPEGRHRPITDLRSTGASYPPPLTLERSAA